MKIFYIIIFSVILSACSSTQYESATLIQNIDNAKLDSVTLYIESTGVILASQANERLFKLHHNAAEVHEMFENVAKRFGFEIADEAHASYRLNVLDAKPDGGQCVEGLSAFNKGFTYTFSVITLGVLPATNSYCMQVNAELFYRPDVHEDSSEDMTPLAIFNANNGRVDVLAGANEVDNYQRVVTIEDEARALETSIAYLFDDMIRQGAFE